MQKRIGFFTDTHLSSKTFSSRKDDYPRSVLEKFNFCVRRCSSRCDVTLFGGDLFDKYKINEDFVKEAVFLAFFEGMKKNHPFLYTFGQHDLYGNDYKNREESVTSFIMRTSRLFGNSLNEIPMEEDLILTLRDEETEEVKKIAVTACPNSEEPISWSQRASNRRTADTCDVRIAVVHHLLSNVEASWFVHTSKFVTTTNDIALRGFDVVLCGDLHDGFEPHLNKTGTLFINPGSVARTKKTKKDITRPIRGVDIVIDDNNEFNYEFWDVECAKPADMVFKEEQPVLEDFIQEELKDNKTENDKLCFDSVVDKLSQIQKKKMNIWDVLPTRASELGIDKKILDFVLSKRK